MNQPPDNPPLTTLRLRTLLSRFSTRPKTKAQLFTLLKRAEKNNLIDKDAFNTMQAVVKASEMQVRDVTTPHAQMVTVNETNNYQQVVSKVIDCGHSRFPVEDEKQQKIIGILLAKDLLRYQHQDYCIQDVMRPAIFVPESKHLNVLLKEFRDTHNHIAIVIDEYGNTAGLITIEDIIEQIIGDIEDEHDLADEVFINKRGENQYLIKAATPIEEFNQQFRAQLCEDKAETIAGLITQKLGRLPKRLETITVGKFKFTILQADNRRVHLLEMEYIDRPKTEKNI